MKYLFGDRVDRNISYQVFLALILVMFAVCGIDFLFLVLNELSDITESYNLRELLSPHSPLFNTIFSKLEIGTVSFRLDICFFR